MMIDSFFSAFTGSALVFAQLVGVAFRKVVCGSPTVGGGRRWAAPGWWGGGQTSTHSAGVTAE